MQVGVADALVQQVAHCRRELGADLLRLVGDVEAGHLGKVVVWLQHPSQQPNERRLPYRNTTALSIRTRLVARDERLPCMKWRHFTAIPFPFRFPITFPRLNSGQCSRACKIFCSVQKPMTQAVAVLFTTLGHRADVVGAQAAASPTLLSPCLAP